MYNVFYFGISVCEVSTAIFEPRVDALNLPMEYFSTFFRILMGCKGCRVGFFNLLVKRCCYPIKKT